MLQREKTIEVYLKAQVNLKGGLCLKWVSPGNNGVPDRIVLMPGGKAYFIEVKRPGVVVEGLQGWWQRQLIGLGFIAIEVNTKEQVDEFIQST